MSERESWDRFRAQALVVDGVGMRVDVSRMAFPGDFLAQMSGPLTKASSEMHCLEQGAVANPDENRMVGHYWLRAPELAPSPELTLEIETARAQVETFSRRVRSGDIRAQGGKRFTQLLVIGIGGSALGPQLVADALGSCHAPLLPHFIDNTDPDGIDRSFERIGPALPETLVLVISKSGSTPETRNGMLEARRQFESAGLAFPAHAVAITGDGSKLFEMARGEGWLETFPMWDWVGGRTSVMSPVGLLPAALLGIDFHAFLDGARRMDAVTRNGDPSNNPAALLAAMWFYAGEGRGARDMVILPYKDRLILFSRYLQQLVMESLGKALDMEGKPVHQGIAVYGNKGSTDQHAYVQQLREGINNFFVTFVQVLEDRDRQDVELEPGVTSGDYLLGFLLGTRAALHENGRESVTITLDALTPASLGALIALYERTVGLYAYLVGVNAYHQPGVEAGKRAASAVLELQKKLQAALSSGVEGNAEELGEAIGARDQVETIFHLLEHLAANGRVQCRQGATLFDNHYSSA